MKTPVKAGDDAAGKWYALSVKARREKTVAQALLYKGLTSFLPVYQERHHWSDRVKAVELPLFPGYVLCRFRLQERLLVLTTPGVWSIVGAGGRPVAIPEDQVMAVRDMVGSGLPVMPWPYLGPGEQVVIQEGPLRGLRGEVVWAADAWKVVVNVDLLQRSVAVTADREAIEVPARRRAGGPAAETGGQRFA